MRKKVALKRRNFLPTLLLAILAWLGVGYLVFVCSPETKLIIFYFYLLFFTSLFFTFSLLFGSARRGFLLGLGITSYFALKQIKQAHALNLLLLLGLLLSIEVYFWKK